MGSELRNTYRGRLGNGDGDLFDWSGMVPLLPHVLAHQ